MMDESKIRFRNEPFIARVTFKKNEVLTCIPVVYDEKLRCGVGILFEDSPGTYWGYVMPRNFIAAWRGTEVLRRLNVLKDETLCYAFHAGLRNPCESDMESRVKPMIVQIGQKAYDEIMSLPVPEQIIRAILDNQKSDPPPDLSPITDEVRAGTIQWRQEFADAGVKHPDEVDAEKRKQEETIATFKRELVSYAKSMHLPRKGLAMGNVENSLLFLIESGASDIPNLELVALAGVMGQLTISCMATAMVCGSSSREEYESWMKKEKEKAIGQSAEWLASHYPSATLLFWKRPLLTQVRAKEVLHKLFEKYLPRKQETVSA